MTRLGLAASTAAAAISIAASADAGGPPMSRGEQYLSISQGECMQRAHQTFAAQGWALADGDQGYSFVAAHKDIHSAYITCNPAGGSTLVNVFVASDRGDGTVPGYQRVLLQQGMAAAASACASAIGRWSWFNGFVVTLNGDGTVTDDHGGHGLWTQTGPRSFDLRWATYNSLDQITVSPDGQFITGSFNGQQQSGRRIGGC